MKILNRNSNSIERMMSYKSDAKNAEAQIGLSIPNLFGAGQSGYDDDRIIKANACVVAGLLSNLALVTGV